MRIEFDDFTIDGDVEEILLVLDATGLLPIENGEIITGAVGREFSTDDELEREFPNDVAQYPTGGTRSDRVDCSRIHVGVETTTGEANRSAITSGNPRPNYTTFTTGGDQTELPFSDSQEPEERDVPED